MVQTLAARECVTARLSQTRSRGQGNGEVHSLCRSVLGLGALTCWRAAGVNRPVYTGRSLSCSQLFEGSTSSARCPQVALLDFIAWAPNAIIIVTPARARRGAVI